MQWLIDLVIAAIGIPPCYVDRGIHDGSDYTLADFVVDGGWHDIDMSEYIGEGATCVNFHLVGNSNVITDVFYFRRKSHTMTFGSCTVRPQIAGHHFGERRPVGCDANRIFSYRFLGAGWVSLKFNIKGWWK